MLWLETTIYRRSQVFSGALNIKKNHARNRVHIFQSYMLNFQSRALVTDLKLGAHDLKLNV